MYIFYIYIYIYNIYIERDTHSDINYIKKKK